MAVVRHRVGIKSAPSEIYEALIHPSRLTGWWATRATGEPRVRSQLDLEFAGLTHLVFEVAELEKDRRVKLRSVGGPDIWIGSELEFALQPAEKQVYLTLTHSKVTADDDSFLYFNTKWPMFLVSLKDFLETGRGRPFPNDIRINHDF
jgi:uncharacterized protein YndB with AHSA1/START domain